MRALGGMTTSMKVAVVAVILIGALAAYLAYQNRRRLFDTCPQSTTAQYVPNPQNDKTLIVYGWSSDEIKKILSDFAATYKVQGFKYLLRTEDQPLRVVFPDDIESALFSFLVNYVQYPIGFDFKHRSIVSTGTVTLTPDFGLPSLALSGKRALFYVPTNDNEYDLVYVRVGENTYENSFAGNCWQPKEDARMPAQATLQTQ
jgi:hypothetical protein